MSSWQEVALPALAPHAWDVPMVSVPRMARQPAPYSGNRRARTQAPCPIYRRVARRLNAPRPRSAVGRQNLRRGGVTKTITTRKKRKRKPKSRLQKLEKRVAKMKGATPKWSHKTFYEHRFLTMRSPGYEANRRGIFCVEALTTEALENVIQNLTQVDSSATADYSTENTSVKIDRYYKLKIAAGSDSNLYIKYAFFKAVDDDNETVLQGVREDLLDRGYTGVAGINPPLLPDRTTTTVSDRRCHVPQAMYPGATTPYFFGVFGRSNVARKWKQLGKVKSATIGPGDTFHCIHSDKVTYKPEITDQEGQTYHKNWDVQLIIEVSGALGHDSTSTGLVGFSSWQMDASENTKHTATYFNPKGLREIDYTDEVDNTNITTIITADNNVSGFNDGGVS